MGKIFANNKQPQDSGGKKSGVPESMHRKIYVYFFLWFP